MVQAYYARLCWNSQNWTKPTGEAAELETKSYVASQGYGHEEWLFRPDLVLNGYKYGFVQPVYRSINQLRGSTIELLLWSISPDLGRVQVGRIKNCEVLSEAQAEEAYRYFEKTECLEQMRDEVTQLTSRIPVWSPESLFNIRFRWKDAEQFGDPFPQVAPKDKINALNRYLLVSAKPGEIESEWRRRLRQGSVDLPNPKRRKRDGHGPTEVNAYHEQLQKDLMIRLKERFGENVVREEQYVDLRIDHGNRTILIEIKADGRPKHAIRAALGQILEYAYYGEDMRARSQSQALELVIVAPGKADEAAHQYIDFLRNQFRLPIRYSQFQAGDSLPEIF